jgi:TetR/AcrR family transcriptional repressor of nem operon
MKVSREQAAATRERILEQASRLFREHGLDGIGVADLMKGAGLTHGGFYAHFDSKEDLMAQACERALLRSAERWTRMADAEGHRALDAIAKSYLSARHRDTPGSGCALATLGSDVPRHGAKVRAAATAGLRALIDALARLMPGRTKAAKRKQALVTYSTMLGALVLARAVDDPALSDEILAAVAEAVGAPG